MVRTNLRNRHLLVFASVETGFGFPKDHVCACSLMRCGSKESGNPMVSRRS